MSILPAPDWQQIIRAVIYDPEDVWGVARGMGNIQLASRLGPIIPVDPRGDLLYQDDFSEGLAHCSSYVIGSGGAVAITSAETAFGPFACKLTGGSTGLKLAEIYYVLPIYPLSKIGHSFRFRIGDDVAYVDLLLDLYDGSNLVRGGLRYDDDNEKVQYYNSAGAWSDLLTGVDLYPFTNYFHPIKLVVDPSLDKYVRAMVAGQEIDMSSYDLYTAVSTTSPQVLARNMVTSETGDNGWIYLDGVLITQNEPA